MNDLPETVRTWLHAAQHGRWPQSGGSPLSAKAASAVARFAHLIACAEAEWEAKQIAGITAAAEERNAKTGQQDWRARAWLLNNHPRTRHTYHEAKELEVTRQEPFLELEQAKALSDTELEAELEQLSLNPGQ